MNRKKFFLPVLLFFAITNSIKSKDPFSFEDFDKIKIDPIIAEVIGGPIQGACPAIAERINDFPVNGILPTASVLDQIKIDPVVANVIAGPQPNTDAIIQKYTEAMLQESKQNQNVATQTETQKTGQTQQTKVEPVAKETQSTSTEYIHNYNDYCPYCWSSCHCHQGSSTSSGVKPLSKFEKILIAAFVLIPTICLGKKFFAYLSKQRK